MQQEVQRAQVRQLIPFHIPRHQVSEVPFDALGGEFLNQDGIKPFFPGDHPNVAGVSLVAGPGMRKTGKRDSHANIF